LRNANPTTLTNKGNPYSASLMASAYFVIANKACSLGRQSG